MDFLKALGLKQPDLYAEIKHFIIPRYQNRGVIDDSITLKDFRKLFTYFLNCPSGRRQDYINEIKEVEFCRVLYVKDGKLYRVKSQKVYLQTEHLKQYFSHYEDVYFLDTDFYQEFYKEFGVR